MARHGEAGHGMARQGIFKMIITIAVLIMVAVLAGWAGWMLRDWEEMNREK